jgi:hypothetical protein
MADGTSKAIEKVKVGDKIANALPSVDAGTHDQARARRAGPAVGSRASRPNQTTLLSPARPTPSCQRRRHPLAAVGRGPGLDRHHLPAADLLPESLVRAAGDQPDLDRARDRQDPQTPGRTGPHHRTDDSALHHRQRLAELPGQTLRPDQPSRPSSPTPKPTPPPT